MLKRGFHRIIQKDGSLNIRLASRRGRRLSLNDLYHDLLKVTWIEFAALFGALFLLLNLLFGWVYSLLPEGQLEGFSYGLGFDRFLECFFFSVQTFGTIGYGKISPVGMLANTLVTLECYTGLFVVALMTGLIFSRFSRPRGKVVASDCAVIRDFDGIPCFMFRIANARSNYVTDARVRVTVAMDDVKYGYRNFYDLELERESSPIFSLSWTIAHDLTQNSPLFGMSLDDMRARNAEVIVSFSGIDTTLSQHVHAKFSYIPDEILIDHDFVDVIHRTEDGSVRIDLSQMHSVRKI